MSSNTLTGTTPAFSEQPVIPMPLFDSAATIPHTCVPCESMSQNPSLVSLTAS